MRTRDFLREKFYYVLFTLFTSTVIFMFLYAVRTNFQVIIIIEILIWITFFCNMFVEFGRRKSFYTKLESILEGLDKKYLLTEVIEEPLFMDGKILHDTLRTVDKSMAEHVNTYRLSQNDYKDYIEMWVHEVKTPLAAAQLVIQNNPGPASESLVEEINKIEDFVDQALYYARSTNPEKDYIIKDISLQESVNKVIRKHSKTFIYKKIRMEIDDIDVHVYSDAKWLEFILNQIIGNALKYTSEQTGVLHIYTTKSENNISLHIHDNGIGIEEHDISRIFDKGFTGTNGRTNEKATGMGLYLCKSLCDKLYLSIDAQSTPSVGTTICITFPISKLMLLK
ncbi:sensor histidine kinase [Amedibacillus sp. YH-ame10]